MQSVNKLSSNISLLEKLSQQRSDQAEKLASGKRINSAADDAATVQVANRLTSNIKQNQQLSFNAQDQANINNIEASALSAINDGLLRAEALSIQSGNPLYDNDVIQGELNQITEQINTIASDVLGQDDYISGLKASDPAATQVILQATASTVNENASALGAENNAIANQVATYQVNVVNVSASRSRLEDTDYAQVTSEQTKNELLLQSTILIKRNEENNKGILFNKLV